MRGETFELGFNAVMRLSMESEQASRLLACLYIRKRARENEADSLCFLRVYQCGLLQVFSTT